MAPKGPSWPQADTTTPASMTLGSMHDWVPCAWATRDQLVTTPGEGVGRAGERAR